MKKRVLALLGCVALLCSLFTVFAFANSGTDLLADHADFLTLDDKAEIVSMLNEASDATDCDIVILTERSLNGYGEMAYADDFYDQNGYGRGESGQDGILLLISLEERVWWISTCGDCISMFSSSDIERIGSAVGSEFANGNYAGAFRYFITAVQKEIVKERSFFSFPRFLAALGIGLFIALIAVSSMKAKLKSVRFQPAASNYLKPGSLNVTLSQESFLYNTVNRTARPKESSSGGGSHTSSGGVSHGGGGGHF